MLQLHRMYAPRKRICKRCCTLRAGLSLDEVFVALIVLAQPLPSSGTTYLEESEHMICSPQRLLCELSSNRSVKFQVSSFACHASRVQTVGSCQTAGKAGCPRHGRERRRAAGESSSIWEHGVSSQPWTVARGHVAVCFDTPSQGRPIVEPVGYARSNLPDAEIRA